MEAIRPKVSHSKSFTGYKVDPKKAGQYLLKRKEVQYLDTLSFLTAITSMTGFAVGGLGLLKDYAHDSKNGLNKKEKNHESFAPVVPPETFKTFESSEKQKIVTNGKSKSEKEKEGARTIVPSTDFAKTALIFAKVGIAFSGIAGIFNGISMGLPLMSAGEALNLAASPIIETPLGTGLFGIALAAVFSGRALENDPMLRLDKVKLGQLKGFKKVTYVLDNMKNCTKEVWTTAKKLSTSFVGLFNKEKKAESIGFFKEAFAIKPKKLLIQEFVNKEGKIQVKTAFKSNPYLMHSASLLLAAGGAVLAVSSLIKNKIGQKVGLKGYEVGGSLDNLSLSRWGWEKAVTEGSPYNRFAGYLLGVSGLTILAGQPGVDTKWGRGTQWAGTALLFGVFAVERFPKAFKTIVSKPEFTSLIRQWEVDLTKMYSKTELGEKLPSGLKRLKSIINSVKSEKEIKDFEDVNLRNIITEATAEITKETKFISDSKGLGDRIKARLGKLGTKFENAFSADGREGKLEEIQITLNKESEKFQAA